MAIFSLFGCDFDSDVTEEDVLVEFDDYQGAMEFGLDMCSVMTAGEYLGIPSMHNFSQSLDKLLIPHLKEMEPGSYVFEGVSVIGTNMEDPENSPDAKLFFRDLRPATDEEATEWA